MPWGWWDEREPLTAEEFSAIAKINNIRLRKEKEILRKKTCIKSWCNQKRVSKFLCKRHKFLSELRQQEDKEMG